MYFYGCPTEVVVVSTFEVPTDGAEVRLSGDQVNYIRSLLKESQRQFAKRLAVSQPLIARLERTGSAVHTGPEIILISMLAHQNGIEVPSNPEGGWSSLQEAARRRFGKGDDTEERGLE